MTESCEHPFARIANNALATLQTIYSPFLFMYVYATEYTYRLELS